MIMSTPPLPPPENFDRKSVTGYLTDRISIGQKEGNVAIVLTGPDDMTLIFQGKPPVIRQVAASLLNQADKLDEGYSPWEGTPDGFRPSDD